MVSKYDGAGQLKERYAFDKREEIDDGEGNFEGRFSEQFQVRAGRIPQRGGESYIAGRLEGRQSIQVRVRASSDTRQIRADWRMRNARQGNWVDSNETVWTGPTYAIKSVVESTDRRWIVITAEEGVAA